MFAFRKHWILCAFLAALGGCEAERASALTFDQESISESLPRGLQRVVTLRASLPVAAVKVGSGAPWLSAEVAADDDSQTLVRVTLDASELEEGEFTTTLSANEAGAAPMKIAVSLTVTPQESLLADLSVVALSIPQGASESANLVVRALTGAPEISWEIATPVSWLSIGTASGASPLALTLLADTTDLAQGHHETALRLTAQGYASALVRVALDVGKPALMFEPELTTISLAELPIAGSFELAIRVSNGDAIDFSLSENASWLSVAPLTGTTPATIVADYDLSAVTAATTPTIDLTAHPVDEEAYDGAVHTVEPQLGVGPRYLLATFGAGSTFDVGWTGNMHGLTFPSNTAVMLRSSCASGPPYTDCRVSGPLSVDIVSSAGLEGTRRCAQFEWIKCDNDSDCPGDATCATYVGPPTPLARPGFASTGACGLIHFISDVRGIVNMDTGALDLAGVRLRSRQFGSANPIFNCPVCTAGVCERGIRHGQACTVGGTHALTGEATSLDCPPSAYRGTEDIELGVVTATSSGSVSSLALTAESPIAANGSDRHVPCGQCRQTEFPGCDSDSDCTQGWPCSPGLGLCFSPSDGQFCWTSSDCGAGMFCYHGSAQSTPCTDLDDSCLAVAGRSGQCSVTKLDRTCSNASWFACVEDAECALNEEGLGQGICSEDRIPRPCFAQLATGAVGDALTATNQVRAANDIELGWVACVLGDTSYFSEVAGFPGPVRVQLQVSTETFE